MIGPNDKMFMTDPDEAEGYKNDLDYFGNHYKNQNYMGFHPFFDDLPKPIHHRKNEPSR